MTGAQLVKMLGVTKVRISKAEQDELHGSVTLKTMQSMAEALEAQSLSKEQLEFEIERIAAQIINKILSDFCNDQ